MTINNHIKQMLGDRPYNHVFYYYLHLKKGVFPKILNLKNPMTFNEKIIWLKINHQLPNANQLVDKYVVRSLIEKWIGARYLVKLIGVYDAPSEIDFASLPESFVLKPNHGSGFIIIVRSKSQLDINGTRRQLAKWLKTDYYAIGRDYSYKGIKRRILCEEYLENSPVNPLIDYKIFCFSGEPTYIQVDLDRFTHHSRNFYDLSWNLLPFTTYYPLGKRILPIPKGLSEMIHVARVLSKGKIFARIDLYNREGLVLFGEITLHHGGGFEPFVPNIYDSILGEHIRLPKDD